MERIEYKATNGYRGVLYGKSNMSIYDPEGREVLHTWFRNANSFDELREVVDDMHEFMKKLNAMRESIDGERKT